VTGRSRVFISYRRVDGAGYAGRLEADLHRALGRRVFIDVTGIEAGEDFEARIRAELKSCRVVLAVIGRDWMRTLNAALQKPGVDFLRLELGEALKDEEVSVIPLLIEGAALPAADELPEDLRGLVRRQARSVRDDHWPRDVEELAIELRQLLGVGRLRALLFRAPWVLPIAAVIALVFALAAWVAHQSPRGVETPPTPDPASLQPFDRDGTHRATIDATRRAVGDCKGQKGASGECPVLFKLVSSGRVGDVYYPVGYCDFKGSPFGNCLLRTLAGLRVRPFASPAEAEVQLDVRVSADGANVEVDE